MDYRDKRRGFVKRSLVIALVFLIIFTAVPDKTAYGKDNEETNFLPGYEAVIYGKSEGLLSTEANAIAQTPEGYLWIGTYSGLYRYDGRYFEKISPDPRISSVMALFVDSEGRMWIGTNDTGVAYYVPNGEEVLFCTKKDGLLSDSIRALAQDGYGNLCIGTVEGLSVMDDQGRVTNPEDFSYLGGIRSLSSSDGLVAGVTGAGSLFLTDGKEIITNFFPDTVGVDFTSVCVNKEGRILAGTSGSGIMEYEYSYEDGSLTLAEEHDGGTLTYCSGIYYDEGEEEWYVCAENGMGLIDEKTGKFTELTQNGFESSVCDALKDYQGNIWFVSNKSGIIKFSPNPFKDVFVMAGLSKNVVNSVALCQEKLFIGRDDGLEILDPVTYRKSNYSFVGALKGQRIRHIMQDSKGNVWLATYGKLGLYMVDPMWRVFTFNEENGTIGGRFRLTVELHDGTIVAASNLGLTYLRDGEVIRTVGRYDGMETPQILTLVEDSDGTLYAGSDGGGIYVIKDGEVIDNINSDDGLDSPVVMRIVPFNGGFFYVTSNAIYYNDGKMIKRLSSFPYNNNYDVRIGEDFKAWVSSSAGIFIVNAFDLANDEIYEYTLLDSTMGFNTSLTANAWNVLLGDDRLLLCCTDGVREISMKEYDYFDKTCHVGVKYILADGENVPAEEDGSYVIPATRGRIQISATILNFTLSNPEVCMFLEGARDDGVYGRQSSISELVYTDLPYGKYRLHIQIIDGMEHTVLREEVFDIFKKPRLFERLAVRILIALAAAGAVAAIVVAILKSTVIRRQYEQIRLAKDEAERANSAKSRFLANMSHEIRTPINTIMGMDEMILREDTEEVPPEYAKAVTRYATDIKRASETLLGLVNDVLDLSKIESGKMNLVEQEYDTNELFRSIVTMIRVRSNQKDLTFDTRIDPHIPAKLYGDMGKIKQVVLNLLTNAVKYTHEGGFVLKVELKEKTEKHCDIYFAVEDTGIGVKPEDMVKLFSAFERLDEKKNTGIQGTGLGLDISRQFVALMGGELKCESEYGKGSIFYFTVRQEVVSEDVIGEFIEKDDRSAKGYIPQFVASKGRVLVVDDNEMNLVVIRGLLKGTKVNVTTALSGRECLEILKKESFNAVFLDHMMPGMDGPETLKKIREEIPERNDVPVIALTANAANDGGSFYKELGFSDYLAKPVDGEVLEKTLKKYMPEGLLEDVNTAAGEAAEDEALPAEYAWLYEVSGISVKDGIRYCGGAESFVKSIKTFFEMLPENQGIIEKAFKESDIENYTVKVHALKSSARIIGASELSHLAEELENAGKAGDLKTIGEKTEGLLILYRSYREKLSGFETEGSGDDLGEDERKDALEALKEFVPQMDYDSAEMVLTEILGRKMKPEAREFFSKMELLLKKLDWDEMEKMLKDEQ